MATSWTEGRKHGFIVNVLRQGTRRYPPKYECLAAAKTKKKKNKETNRLAQHYRCNACKKEFPLSKVQVDHITPVVDPATGFVSWDMYIDRLFCGIDNLQVLCTTCHNKKTKEERGSKKSIKNK